MCLDRTELHWLSPGSCLWCFLTNSLSKPPIPPLPTTTPFPFTFIFLYIKKPKSKPKLNRAKHGLIVQLQPSSSKRKEDHQVHTKRKTSPCSEIRSTHRRKIELRSPDGEFWKGYQRKVEIDLGVARSGEYETHRHRRINLKPLYHPHHLN